MTTITEGDVEQAALDRLSGLGWQVAHGPDIAPDTPNAEQREEGRPTLIQVPQSPASTLVKTFLEYLTPLT